MGENLQTAHYIVTWIYYFLMLIVVKGLIQVNIPYVNYFYNWRANRFIKMYTNLCQFNEVGKYKWPPENFLLISPSLWFNRAGTDIFDSKNQSFIVKQFIDKRSQKKEERKMKKVMRFWHDTQTFFDKIVNVIELKTKVKQQVLVIYQSDDNYARILNSKENKSISYTGEHSLLFVFYLTDKTEIYRINNAEIVQEKKDNLSNNKITYFHINNAMLKRI